MAYTVRFCSCCGSMLKPSASCFKGCGAEIVTGTMDAAIAQQSAYVAAQAARVPNAEETAKAEASAATRAEYLAAASEARRASLAKTATPAARFGSSTRPQWQRACTCGHCMTCIGE